MNWAISNLTGGNRVSRAILVRYSSVPLAEDGVSTPAAAATPRASASAHSSLSSTFAATFLHSSSSRHLNNNNNNNNNGGTCAAGATPQLSLPLDVEETVTCFCR
ncbi:MOB kinase activator-like 2 [Drosophila novamexicana]|uniref:MOB kinase activator-like 2 n=1 Tax=Drosophila novamexicana TaxID=47314 RepID=UPI0011E5ECE4|nr:MOB kinase activator-like 2 [Drosophila novamexicana]